MKKTTISLALSLLMSAQVAMAVPAKPTPMVFTQPDGTTVTLKKIGDERFHMTITPDGYPVAVDANGFYCYADLNDKGALKATAVKALPLSQLSATERLTVSQINAEKVRETLLSRSDSDRYSAPMRMGSHGGIGLMDDAFIGRKELSGLVILVQYSDVKFSETCTREFFHEMLNAEGFSQFRATGSARDYFIDSSNGQFYPTFDVYGPVTLGNPMKYYGGNDDNGSDENAALMIYDACKGLDDQINFKDYDLDGDGYVDNVFVFYAGYGEASYGSANSVWPHQWNLTSAGLSLTLDGVRINKYACSNELSLDSSRKPIPDGIGTFVHEFSHVLGLPDLYATSATGGYWTPGSWSVLDQGPYNNDSRTPPAYSIYERNALGWIDPIIIDGAESITLEAINKSNQGYLIPTSSKNEFFLIENRQQTGWDKYIPGHGMLVWHIDYNANVWRRNTVNNSRNHSYVDIEEARGSWADPADFTSNGYIDYDAYDKAIADYAFPGSMGATSFTDTTTPSMTTWAGASLGLPITDITEEKGVITFNVLGGRCDAEVPVANVPSEVGMDYFVASWNPSEGATEYFLTVQAVMKNGIPTTVVADFGSSDTAELPEGWSFISSKGDVYTSKSNFGESSPSLKLLNSGSGFMTGMFDGNVSSISFWLKGIATDKNSVLVIEGNIDGAWRNISSITPQSLKATTVNIDEIPEGVRQLRFTYNKSTGNIGIDDVKITYGGSGNVTLSDYSNLAVGNVTSYRVDKLIDGVDEYVYKVRAADASAHRTAYSNEQNVILGQNAGIESVGVDPKGTFAVEGCDIIYTGSAADRITLTDISGRVYADRKADAEGHATITAPSAGVYIVSSPGKIQKLIVR